MRHAAALAIGWLVLAVVASVVWNYKVEIRPTTQKAGGGTQVDKEKSIMRQPSSLGWDNDDALYKFDLETQRISRMPSDGSSTIQQTQKESTTTTSQERNLPNATTKKLSTWDARPISPSSSTHNNNHHNTTTESSTNLTTTHKKNHDDDAITMIITPTTLQGQKFLLVHIGKTAGSSVVCALGKRYPSCKNNQNYHAHAPSRLGDALAGTTHMSSSHVDAMNNDFDLFLVVVRNPLDRLISWFAYEHPRNTKPFGPGKACSAQLHAYTKKKRQKQQHRTNGCFASLQEFAGNVTQPVDGTNSSNNNTTNTRQRRRRHLNAIAASTTNNNQHDKVVDCPALAWRVATGQEFCYGHNGYNYQFYWHLMQQVEPAFAEQHDNLTVKESTSSTPTGSNDTSTTTSSTRGVVANHTKARIVVMRTEHLAHDWDVLERMFGGGGDDSGPSGAQRFAIPRNKTPSPHSGNQTNATNGLDDAGRHNLCLALCHEFQVYKILLQRALNLSPADVLVSLREVQAACPSETLHLRTCDAY